MNGFDASRRRALARLGAAAALPFAASAGTAAFARATPRAEAEGARAGIALVGPGGYGALALERLSQSRIARPATIVSGNRDKALQVAVRSRRTCRDRNPSQ